jgi:predicted ATPase/DNA-binding SARP family transcriptional activator
MGYNPIMARLILSLLGAYTVMLDDQPLTTFELDKARALLAYLAVEARRPHRRETLAGLLWPDIPDASARQSLRQALFSLRQTIGDQATQPPFLLVTRDTIQFNPASDHTLDVAIFNTRLSACDAHRHIGLEICEECARHLTQASELYRGPFLHDFALTDSEAFEEWAVLTRESLHRRALDALLHLAGYHARRRDHPATLRYARRQLELDPWHEEAHRQVMRALASDGRRSEALAQYEHCRRVLANELGVEPSTETTALYQHIKDEGSALRAIADAVASSPRPSFTLPTQLTPFVGRERELALLAELLADPHARLITLVGAGGMGKTRLAIQTALGQQHFAQGVVFVPLAPLASADLIAPAIASALNFSLAGQADPQVQLQHYLREQQILLILDNFEHLMEGVPLVIDLLRAAPHLKILVTSREILAVQSEWVFDVEGLGSDAQTLFFQSARRARVGLTLSVADRQAVEKIGRLVGGMPLAIELAASWVRTLAYQDIARKIEAGLDILATSARDVPDRHRSINTVFDYSWRLLSEDERRVLRRLVVFRGGFTREAAEQVASATLTRLASLIGKSLVQRSEAGRYDLHDLVRQYAVEHLDRGAPYEGAGSRQAEASDVRQAHAAYYLEWVEATAAQLYGPHQAVCAERLEQEQDNWRAAFEWSLNSGGREVGRYVESTLRQATALARFWIGHYLREGRQWLEQALAIEATLATRAPTMTRANALNIAGWLARTMNDFGQAKTFLNESLALCREAQDAAGIASVLDSLGDVAWSEGDYEQASVFYEESLVLRRGLGVKSRVALSLSSLANAVMEQGDTLRAVSLYEESVALCQELGDERGMAMALHGLGLTASLRNDNDRAAYLLKESLTLFHKLNNKLDVALCIECLGLIATAQGQMKRALRLWGASEAMCEALGTSLQANYKTRHERSLALARAQLSRAESVEAFAMGQAMMPEQVVLYALVDNPA